MAFDRVRVVLLSLLLVVPGCAAGQSTSPDLLGTAWVAEDIAGRGVLDRARSGITFTPDGSVQGSGGCNRFSGGYVRDGATLRIGQLAATRMACPPALMDQESRFLAALSEVRGWRIENGLLHLTDSAGATVIRAAPQR